MVIGDLLDGDGRALAESIGANAAYVHLDVTSPQGWSEVVRVAGERFGGLDVPAVPPAVPEPPAM